MTKPTGKPRRGTPIRIRGVDYPSVQEAARQIGVNPCTIYVALDKGTLENCGISFKAKRVCTFDGVEYPSLVAAGMALGVTSQAIWQRLENRKKGLKVQFKKPCRVGGVEYESISAAARALGMGNETLRKRLERAAAKGVEL